MLDRHILLLGFKNVGKSVVGERLAQYLSCNFIDLDRHIEAIHHLSCRSLMQQHGEAFFRQQETAALRTALLQPCSVIALGGGAVLAPDNQALIKTQCAIHLTATQSIVFTRIMCAGMPAFLNPKLPPLPSLKQLWRQREPLYRACADFSVTNAGTIDATCKNILNQLKLP